MDDYVFAEDIKKNLISESGCGHFLRIIWIGLFGYSTKDTPKIYKKACDYKGILLEVPGDCVPKYLVYTNAMDVAKSME